MTFRASGEAPTTKIAFSSAGATEIATDALILTAAADNVAWAGALAAVDAALDGALKQAVADADFQAKVGKTHLVATLGRLPAKRIIVSGLAADGASAEDVRRAYGAAVGAARRAGAQTSPVSRRVAPAAKRLPTAPPSRARCWRSTISRPTSRATTSISRPSLR